MKHDDDDNESKEVHRKRAEKKMQIEYLHEQNAASVK